MCLHHEAFVSVLDNWWVFELRKVLHNSEINLLLLSAIKSSASSHNTASIMFDRWCFRWWAVPFLLQCFLKNWADFLSLNVTRALHFFVKPLYFHVLSCLSTVDGITPTCSKGVLYLARCESVFLHQWENPADIFSCWCCRGWLLRPPI